MNKRQMPFLLALALGALAASAQAATITVTGNGDTVAVDAVVTLREAIESANSNSAVNADVVAQGGYGSDTVNFDSTFFGTAKTIAIGSALAISSHINIQGPAAGVTVDGGDQSFAVFVVDSGFNAGFDRLTITHGESGIDNSGTTTVTNSTLTGNGDGILNFDGSATVTNSVLSGNNHGIYSLVPTTVTNSVLSDNTTGIYNFDTTTVTGSTLSNNGDYAINTKGTANVNNSTLGGNGSGIKNTDVLNLTNSTIKGNGDGTGISNGGTAVVTNSTVTGNSYGIENDTELTLKNALVVGNSTENVHHFDEAFTFTDGGGNRLTGTATEAGLDPDGLKDNGGPTQTIALLVGSPAINAGTPSGAPATDQRGYARINTADIGAYEFSGLATEIAVEQEEATDLTDGSDTAIDFGDTIINTSSSAKTFTIKNTGPGNLTGIAITIDGANFSNFAINTTATSTTIAPNGSTTFTVTFTPGTYGASAATLHIASNDDDENPFDIMLSGNGVEAPSLVVTSLGDTTANDGETTLREAIIYADDKAGNDTITFDSSFDTPQTITSGSALAVNSAINIQGPTAGVTVDGVTQSFDVFTVGSSATAGFDRLTVTKGNYGISNNGGTATITNSTLSGNSTAAISNYGTTNLTNSTVSGNVYDGITSFAGAVTVTNSTVSGNEYAIYNNGSTATVTNSTLADNKYGIYEDSTATLKNSLVVGNSENNVDAGFTDGGGNRTTGTAAEAGLDPDGLKDNGGPTQTIALLVGSPAINAGTPSGAPATDQRGYSRPDTVDIGAYEFGGLAGEIAVEQEEATDLTDGSDSAIDFGDTAFNTSSAAKTFTIKNTGTGNLTGIAITKDGANSDNFAIDATATSATIAPNGSTTFTVTFTPGTYGASAATLHIASNDGDESPFDIKLSGNGTEVPSLVVTSVGDTEVDDGETTLREAVFFANNNDNAGTDTITFDPATFGTAQTIRTSLFITSAVNIQGPAAGVTVTTGPPLGGNRYGQTVVISGATVGLDRLTISGGEYGINNNSGTVTVTNSTLTDNDTGVINFGTTHLVNSTVSGNKYDGLTSLTGDLTITNSTVSGNKVAIAIRSSVGTVTVTNSTVSGNEKGISVNSTATLKNSLVVGNSENNVEFTFVDGGGNRTTGTAADASLDPDGLKNNGGPTKTIALLAGSPAINMGTATGAPETDQRGYARLGTADIGAYEYGGTVTNSKPVITWPSGNGAYSSGSPAILVDAAATLTDPDSADLAGGTLTLQPLSGQTMDVYSIRNQGTDPGQIGTSGGNVTYGGTIIGTFSGGIGTNSLVVSFNAQATPAIAQVLMRNITFATIGTSTISRVSQTTVSDGDGGTSTPINKTIIVSAPTNTAPVATDSSVSTEEDTPLDIELADLVSDDKTADANLEYTLVDEPPAEEGTVELVGSKVTFTPAENFAGETSFTYYVTDAGDLDSATKKVTINVTSENDAPVLDPIGDQNATEGVELAFTAEADDAEDNLLTFSLVGAPAGAAITDDGNFTWTPSEAQGPGSFTFKVRVSDGDKTDEEEIKVTVAEVNSAPVLPFVGARTLKYGGTTTFNFAASDSDLPANTLTYSLIGAPTGASINPTTGVFSWTPTAAQSNNNFYSFKVKVVDNGTPQLSDEETASFTVQRPNATNAAPVLPFIGSRTIFLGATASFNFAATDADVPQDTLAYSLVGAPSGASINPSTGVFSWTPTAGQAVSPNNFYSFKVKVTDDGFPAKSDEETASFTVAFPADISVNTTNPSLKANNTSQSVTFTYTVRNNTNTAYSNLQVKGDVFWPSTLQSVVLTPSAGTTGQVFALTATSKWVQWTIPSLPAGTSKTISVKLTGVVPTSAPQKSKIASAWTLSSATTGVIPSMSSPEVFLGTYK